MAFFTVESEGQPICTFAADDLQQAGQLAEVERADWAEIGAVQADAAISVRPANIGEALLWKEMAAEAVDDGEVDDLQDAEDSIVAFHVPVDETDEPEDSE
jgi:hypothetical protein